jgi:hypothetical protein
LKFQPGLRGKTYLLIKHSKRKKKEEYMTKISAQAEVTRAEDFIPVDLSGLKIVM